MSRLNLDDRLPMVFRRSRRRNYASSDDIEKLLLCSDGLELEYEGRVLRLGKDRESNRRVPIDFLIVWG